MGLAAGKITPEARYNYIQYVGGTSAMWKALELSTSGMQLPPALASMAAAKTAYFDPQYLALRDRLADVLLKGDKSEMTAIQWSPITVGRMASAVAVAEAALDASKAHTLDQRGTAERALSVQLVLLALAIGLAVGAIMQVSRRVIDPINTIRDAMLKVAGGDLDVDSGYLDRRDEIGALAGALESFKQQPPKSSRASSCRRAVEAYVGEFEGAVRKSLGASEAKSLASQTANATEKISEQIADIQKVAGDAIKEASWRRHRYTRVKPAPTPWRPPAPGGILRVPSPAAERSSSRRRGDRWRCGWRLPGRSRPRRYLPFARWDRPRS